MMEISKLKSIQITMLIRNVDEHEAKNLLEKCHSINMIGKKTISLATSLGIGSEKSIRRIEGMCHF